MYTTSESSAYIPCFQTLSVSLSLSYTGQGCCQMISEGRGGWPSGIMPRKSRALALMRPANRQQNPAISHRPWLSHRNIERQTMRNALSWSGQIWKTKSEKYCMIRHKSGVLTLMWENLACKKVFFSQTEKHSSQRLENGKLQAGCYCSCWHFVF